MHLPRGLSGGGGWSHPTKNLHLQAYSSGALASRRGTACLTHGVAIVPPLLLHPDTATQT